MKFSYPTTRFVFLTLLWIKAVYPHRLELRTRIFTGTSPTESGLSSMGGFRRGILSRGQWPVSPTSSPNGWAKPLWDRLTGSADWTVPKFVSVLLAGITLWFAWKAAERYVHPSIALVVVLCNLVQIVMPMRPQLFTFALLAVGAWLVTGWLSTEKQRHLLGYPIVMALWVNLHGGFVVGLVLICLTAIGLTLEAIEKGAIRSDKSLAFVWGIVVASLATRKTAAPGTRRSRPY